MCCVCEMWATRKINAFKLKMGFVRFWFSLLSARMSFNLGCNPYCRHQAKHLKSCDVLECLFNPVSSCNISHAYQDLFYSSSFCPWIRKSDCGGETKFVHICSSVVLKVYISGESPGNNWNCCLTPEQVQARSSSDGCMMLVQKQALLTNDRLQGGGTFQPADQFKADAAHRRLRSSLKKIEWIH